MNKDSKETLDIKSARRTLLNNIQWLKGRIETLDLNSVLGQQMIEFYSAKIRMHQHCLSKMNEQCFGKAA